MENNINQIILEELRDLRKKVDEIATDNSGRISVLETSMKDLMGNGQPGRIKVIEEALAKLIRQNAWFKGYVALMATIGTTLIALHEHIAKMLNKLFS